MNVFQRFFTSSKEQIQNKFNQAFFSHIGTSGSTYDPKQKSLYLEKGYQANSFVYSIIQAQARKTAAVPYFIKKVESEQKAKSFQREIKRSNIADPQIKRFLKDLEAKAFVPGDDNLDFPLEKPNVSQSWSEFLAMYKTYMKISGNAFIYMVSPEDGANADTPIAMYLLPSPLIDIVVKEGADLLIDENPVDSYMLIEGAQYIPFESKDVVHIKYPNPEFNLNGSHLYGQSPLRAAAKSLESSNEAMNNNIKTMKNSGAFGLISGKNEAITTDQAASIKERLSEMDTSNSRLSNIAGVSQSIDFTRLSLSTKDLMPFDFLHFDKKQIAACLNWLTLDSDASDFGGTLKELKKENIVGDILPDLNLFEQAFNNEILPRFKNKGYENTMLVFDASTLPEMQADMATLTTWLSTALLDGTINRNEYRDALNYPIIDNNPDFERYTTKMGIIPLEEAFIVDELIDTEAAAKPKEDE